MQETQFCGQAVPSLAVALFSFSHLQICIFVNPAVCISRCWFYRICESCYLYMEIHALLYLCVLLYVFVHPCFVLSANPDVCIPECLLCYIYDSCYFYFRILAMLHLWILALFFVNPAVRICESLVCCNWKSWYLYLYNVQGTFTLCLICESCNLYLGVFPLLYLWLLLSLFPNNVVCVNPAICICEPSLAFSKMFEPPLGHEMVSKSILFAKYV